MFKFSLGWQVVSQNNLDAADAPYNYHVSSILAKLGVRTRTEAVRFGINRGLVPI